MLDDDGKPAPVGTRGHLVLTHPFPALARRLWDEPERYRATYLSRFPGYYYCSDLAVIDCDGEHWVLGRADDVINVAAHRISTVELESVVSQTPGVAEAAVIAIDDAIKGTVPIAFISLCAGADADTVRRDAAQSVEKAIGGIARLERVVVTSALPKSRAGKILRRLLRELAETGTVKGDVSGLEDMATVDAVRAALSVQ